MHAASLGVAVCVCFGLQGAPGCGMGYGTVGASAEASVDRAGHLLGWGEGEGEGEKGQG